MLGPPLWMLLPLAAVALPSFFPLWLHPRCASRRLARDFLCGRSTAEGEAGTAARSVAVERDGSSPQGDSKAQEVRSQ